MCEKKMMLKNSPAVNKPFRSLFNCSKSPSNSELNVVVKDLNRSTNLQPNFIKRKISQELLSVKKSKLDIKSDQENIGINVEQISVNADLDLQKRIQHKQKEIERLKNEILYCKKHNLQELEADTKRWKHVCQKALERLRGDLMDKQTCIISINDLLISLGIPKDLVCYSSENDMFID